LEEYVRKAPVDQPSYFQEVAKNFVVHFQEYPLTFLLGLFEALLEPDAAAGVEEREWWIVPQDGPDELRTGTSRFFVRSLEGTEDGPKRTPVVTVRLGLW